MDLNQLVQLVQASNNFAVREAQQAAELRLKESACIAGFTSGLLQIVANTSFDESLRLFAAIVFKNNVKKNWNPAEAEHPVTDAERVDIRAHIYDLMMNVSPKIRRTLSEAIHLIGVVDFPKEWGSLVDQFVTTLTTAHDLSALDAALSAAHSVLERYRAVDHDLLEITAPEVRNLNAAFIPPLLHVLQHLFTVMTTPSNGAAMCKNACEIFTTALEALFDLIAVYGIGDDFEQNIGQFMTIFKAVLELQTPELFGSEYTAGPLVELKSAVYNVICQMTRISHEDMEPFVSEFLRVTWDALTSASSGYESQDNLVITAIEFVASIVASPLGQSISDAGTLIGMVEKIIMPNLAMQTSDMELFTDEPESYIAREVEGATSHTRRRAATDLIRSLTTHYEQAIAQIITNHIGKLAASQDWRDQSTCMTLVTAVALHGTVSGLQRGAVANATLSTIVNLKDYFLHHVVPLLTPPENPQPLPAGSSPQGILACDSIRFVTLFRPFLVEYYSPILSTLATWITAGDQVPSSLAAHAIERLLTVRIADDVEGYRITPEVLGPLTETILGRLGTRVATEKKPNTYAMLAIMRLCMNVPVAVAPFAAPVLQHLQAALTEACKNPSNPMYNHAMFESIAAIIALCPEHTEAIEGMLWEAIFNILVKDVVEFVPYALQIMGQFLDARPDGQPLPEHYQSLIAPLLAPAMYEQPGTIPAVVRMLTAVIRRDAGFLVRQNLVERVLQIFCKLLFTKAHDHDGLNILTALIVHAPYEVLQPFEAQIYISLFNRLQNGRTPKYIRCIILFMSVLIITHGVERVVQGVNNVQAGLFWIFLQRIWLPNMQKVVGHIERTTCVVALTALICESAALQGEQAVWQQCVYECLRMIHCAVEKDDTAFTPKYLALHDLRDTVGDGGFSNAYCPLTASAAKPINPCPQVANANAHLRQNVAALMQRRPDLQNVLQQSLTPDLLQLIS